MPVQKGDRIYIPPRNYNQRVLRVKWTDWFREYSANYVGVTAKNQTQQNEDIQLFLAEDWYDYEHLSAAAARELPPPGGWLIDVTDRFQYGNFNTREGQQRFLVFHDKDNRSPYQHMFVENGQHVMTQRMNNMMQSVIPGFLEGLSRSAGPDVLSTQFGDFLNDF
ncbi:hypothetical protein DACRYDRAFT_109470 [Dacryopinax primogenitus]|uniref:Uncharacterized protein n=1 Tax=Dacryopinax primogenitus (strain DJM 731) TaxID=1858805 RepID=M5FRZ5_DACPD|nr:uncharacterized protein DACRYDRAFT_109470 [Dacryopinax primogenitus]EJU00046.1 hypothetical protein DACRYDRAFT_109470 [Dacryopinax primogenitus]